MAAWSEVDVSVLCRVEVGRDICKLLFFCMVDDVVVKVLVSVLGGHFATDENAWTVERMSRRKSASDFIVAHRAISRGWTATYGYGRL